MHGTPHTMPNVVLLFLHGFRDFLNSKFPPEYIDIDGDGDADFEVPR